MFFKFNNRIVNQDKVVYVEMDDREPILTVILDNKDSFVFKYKSFASMYKAFDILFIKLNSKEQ